MKDQCHLNACFCNMRSHLSNWNGTAHVCHTKCEKNPLLFFHKPAIAVCMSLHHVTCQPSDLHIFFHRNLTVISDSLIKIFLRIVNHQPEPPNKHGLMLTNHESNRKTITNLKIIEKVYFLEQFFCSSGHWLKKNNPRLSMEITDLSNSA